MSKFISEINENFMKDIENKKKLKREKAAQVTNEDREKFMKKMAFGDEKTRAKNRAKLGEGLVDEVSLDIPSELMWGQFMQMGNFTADRSKWFYLIKNKNLKDGVSVYGIHGNGTAPQKLMVHDKNMVSLFPYRITSNEYSMRKFALELGFIDEPQNIKQEAQEDILWRLEDDVYALLENGLYNDITQLPGINIGSRVKEIPLTNDLDLSDQGGITLYTLKAIAKYARMMGKTIESIYAPVSGEFDIWDWTEVPQRIENVSAGDYTKGNPYEGLMVIPEDIRRQIVKTGNPGELFGRNFNITSNNTLEGDPTKDDVYIWIKLSGGCGHLRYFTGGTFSDEFSREDADNIYYTLKKTVMLFQTPEDRTNYLRVKIKGKVE